MICQRRETGRYEEVKKSCIIIKITVIKNQIVGISKWT